MKEGEAVIEWTRGDILQADAEALVNTVNCVGIMGRGIALQFRKAFPENYKLYRAVCERGELHPGMMLVYDLGRLHNPRYIVNFPTKRHWKGKSRIEDIEAGLPALVEEVRRYNIRSIAIPPLGSGLGGLDWKDVRPRIERAFRDLPDVHVLIYEPGNSPAAEEMPKGKRIPHMTAGRAALIGLIRRYLAAAMDPWVTLLEIHKLMYFMQEAGQPLRLRYEKGFYGPYATNLRHVLNEIEGHFIGGYGDAADHPNTQIRLIPEATHQAEDFLAEDEETRQRFDQVADLIEGFETPFGMELLTTIHWVVTQEGVTSPEDAVAKVYAWNARKRMFGQEHLRVAWDTLVERGWMPTSLKSLEAAANTGASSTSE